VSSASGLPRVSDLSAFDVGATRPAGEAAGWTPREAEEYVPRPEDRDIEDAIRSRPFVVVVGPSKAGKSRTAFEAVRRAFPLRHLIAPTERTP
jgi:cellulose synthase operon protein C